MFSAFKKEKTMKQRWQAFVIFFLTSLLLMVMDILKTNHGISMSTGFFGGMLITMSVFGKDDHPQPKN